MIRVALVAQQPRVSATRDFTWFGPDGRTVAASGRGGDQWRVERDRGASRVRVVSPHGAASSWQRALVARPPGNGFLTVNGKRYRGTIAVISLDTGLVIVNRLGVEDYLLGVVPVEMGRRGGNERAALQAQAVASRSYAFVRMSGATGRTFDVRGSTADQGYGGVEVEYDAASDAVDATRGLVLRYGGRVADAPYSSACGGSTAEAAEVWRAQGAPYLKRISDKIDGSERYYCEIAPRHRWTRTIPSARLDAALRQYLASYASVPSGGPGSARSVLVRGRTASGRAASLEIRTDRGTFRLRGNDMRYVMRETGGEILYSTYFSVESEHDGDGRLARVTLQGQGNGHGIGMCQWGAIGRARAGQSFLAILGTYYPGTSVGPAPAQ